jgi:hypothetical protein
MTESPPSLGLEFGMGAEVPHGEVTVRAVQGGLRVPNSDTVPAGAAITVSARRPV